MRFLLSLIAALAVCACSKPPQDPIPDFTPYLHIKPGTRVKVTPYIEVLGDIPGTNVVREAARKSELSIAVTGTVTAISKSELSIRPDNPKNPVGFIPSGVRSIEVLVDPSAPPKLSRQNSDDSRDQTNVA